MTENLDISKWSCTTCTYLNPRYSSQCDICGHSNESNYVQPIDLTESSSSPLPWQPVYHFKSPELYEASPNTDQSDCLSLADVVTEGAEAVVLMNYIVDIPFLIDQCPVLRKPEVDVLVLHGSKGKTESLNETRRELGMWHWVVSEVIMGAERYGTHHSKIILVFYSTGVRVCIMTANLIETDVHHLTQGIYVQDFPYLCTSTTDMRESEAQGTETSAITAPATHKATEGTVETEAEEDEKFMFRTPLLQYMAHIKSNISQAAGIVLNQRMAQLQRVNFSRCKAALIPSRPGRHEDQKDRWGACRMASVLSKYGCDGCSKEDVGRSTLVMQCSSIGSMGKNEQFINELAGSMTAVCGNISEDQKRAALCTTCGNTGDGSVPKLMDNVTSIPIEIVWPSVRCIAHSYLGYQSGGSIPCNSDTIEEVSQDGIRRVKKGFADKFRKWDGSSSGRDMFPAHMKCYFRYCPENSHDATSHQLQWFLLTSANLSQAAWGKKQRNGHILYIKSYEMGVLFLPSWLERQQRLHGETPGQKLFSCTPDHRILGTNFTPSQCTASASTCPRGLDEEKTVDTWSKKPSSSKKRKFDDVADNNVCPCIFAPKSTVQMGADSNSQVPVSSSASTTLQSHLDLPMKVYFSIPFSIPAEKFDFVSDDYPWTWDKSRPSPDRNGLTIMR
mmetsp:Transcript_19666/g.33127  ORF Transcript_19666/g.33127 Transcript_19666/m.33127 type:complete len:673 (+) Transcript_19666:74-2092(+)